MGTGAADLKLPNAVEAEKAVLAAALVDPACVGQILDAVQSSDFYSPRHQAIYKAIDFLHSDGVAYDVALIIEKIKSDGGTVDGLGSYMGELLDFPVASDITRHCGLIRQSARDREALAAMSAALAAGVDPRRFKVTTEKVLEALEECAMTAKPKSHLFDKPLDLTKAISEKPPAIAFFIKDRLPAGRGILLSALGGSSKTRLLYHLAVGAVTGELPWDWEVERTGKSVLVLTEDIEDDSWRVIHHLGKSLSPEQRNAIVRNLIIYPLAGHDVKLLIRNDRGTLERSPLFYELIDRIKAIEGVVFVALDPALSVTEGDENDQNHQRAVGKMADDLAILTGATVVLASHSTKASLNTPELTSHNSRGGGAITDAARAEFSMRNMTPEEAAKAGISDLEERKRHVQLVATKGNTLPPSAFVPVWLRRDENGMLQGADLNFDANKGPDKRDIQTLNTLVEMSAHATPALREWREECISRGIFTGDNPDAQRKAMQRCIKRLSASRLIEKGIGKGVWIPTDGGNFQGHPTTPITGTGHILL